MRKKTIVKCLLLAILLLMNFLVFVHLRTVKDGNKKLTEELLIMNKITHQFREKGASSKQNSKEIESILQELDFGVYLKHLVIKKDHVQLQLEGVSQEQLFMFLRVLSEETNHRLIQCNISQQGDDHLTLSAEIQLL